jgi:hypothetical protein
MRAGTPRRSPETGWAQIEYLVYLSVEQYNIVNRGSQGEKRGARKHLCCKFGEGLTFTAFRESTPLFFCSNPEFALKNSRYLGCNAKIVPGYTLLGQVTVACVGFRLEGCGIGLRQLPEGLKP